MKANTSTKIRLIASALDLCKLAAYVNAGNDCAPIGNDTNKFNGDGHTIDNLQINSSGDYVGLFGYVGNRGTIKNIRLTTVNISGENFVGGFVGYNGGKISNCLASGSVNGNETCGGLVGSNSGSIETCTTSGTVNGTNNVGGFVGLNFGRIQNCTATATVNGDDMVRRVRRLERRHDSKLHVELRGQQHELCRRVRRYQQRTR